MMESREMRGGSQWDVRRTPLESISEATMMAAWNDSATYFVDKSTPFTPLLAQAAAPADFTVK